MVQGQTKEERRWTAQVDDFILRNLIYPIIKIKFLLSNGVSHLPKFKVFIS